MLFEMDCRTCVGIVCVFAGIVCVSSAADLDTNSPAVQNQIVEEHNRIRRVPSATDMERMSWDPAIQSKAQQWADKCEFRHPGDSERDFFMKTADFGLGQNIAMGTGSSLDWAQSMKMWSDEVQHFQYGVETDFAKVGHYTQMVWAKTLKIGCGYKLCKAGSSEQFNFMVCNYGPAGNVSPNIFKPYTPGSKCGSCPNSCDNGLCGGSAPRPAPGPAPGPAAEINWNGNWAMGCDFNGGDFEKVQIRGEDCGGQCAKTSGCTHFTWSNWNGGTCFLKNGEVSKSNAVVADQSKVCGVISSSTPPASSISWNGNWAMGCDFNGGDLEKVHIRGEDCGDQCAKTSGCTHFTWSNWNGGTCFLKNGKVSKSNAVVADQSKVCGVITSSGSDIKWNGNWAMGCDFRGRDFQEVRIRGEDCGGHCAKTSGCSHFAWSKKDGGTCFLKQGKVSKSDAVVADQSMVCGVME